MSLRQRFENHSVAFILSMVAVTAVLVFGVAWAVATRISDERMRQRDEDIARLQTQVASQINPANITPDIDEATATSDGLPNNTATATMQKSTVTLTPNTTATSTAAAPPSSSATKAVTAEPEPTNTSGVT